MKQKRISRKMLETFISKITEIKPSRLTKDSGKCYYSIIDGSYFTRVGMENHLKMLLKRGITEQLQNSENNKDYTVNIGFNPDEQKWYGWSHRAIYGFGIGSEVKKGDCAYQPFDKEDFLSDCVRFWDDENHIDTTGIHVNNGIQVNWKYDNKVKNKKIRGTISGIFCEYPKEWGKGAWKAKTLKEARQMAADFAEGVS